MTRSNWKNQVAKILERFNPGCPRLAAWVVYPTMVMETTDLSWTLDTIAHEWTHNYLNLRPWELYYSTTPELRTMNETTASIAGSEVGTYVLQNYYPELNQDLLAQNLDVLQRRETCPQAISTILRPSIFRAEMHETRVTTDKLLADGKMTRLKLIWKSAGRSSG
jgi:hypothetical protein